MSFFPGYSAFRMSWIFGQFDIPYGTYYQIITQNMLLTMGLLTLGTAHDLNKCLQQIKLPISLLTCAAIFDLPSNISSMMFTKSKLGHQSTINKCQVLLWNFLVLIA